MSESLPTCPGQYCGRSTVDAGGWSECGACPRGFRANLTSYCVQCSDTPSLYDWQYLGFMALLPLVLHWFFIDLTATGRSQRSLLLAGVCALLEVAGGAAGALLAVAPRGSFALQVCRPRLLADWYTLLHNPAPGYGDTLHCTQEAVYPLYSVVLMMYGLSLVLTLTMRPWLEYSRLCVYSALYFYPLLVLIHTVAAGLIYNSFPYVIIIISMLSSASHLAAREEQTALGLLLATVTEPRNLIILLGHWLVHAYGLVSITGLKEPLLHGVVLGLVPAPALFYVLTAQFTDPHKHPHYD